MLHAGMPPRSPCAACGVLRRRPSLLPGICWCRSCTPLACTQRRQLPGDCRKEPPSRPAAMETGVVSPYEDGCEVCQSYPCSPLSCSPQLGSGYLPVSAGAQLWCCLRDTSWSCQKRTPSSRLPQSEPPDSPEAACRQCVALTSSIPDAGLLNRMTRRPRPLHRPARTISLPCCQMHAEVSPRT